MYSADPTAKGQKAPVSAAGGSRPALSFSPPKTYYGLAVYTYFYTANSRKEISVMPAIINGIVYDDRNQNGQYDVGEPGIPGVFVLLYTPSGSCSATQSDSNGSYAFPSPRQAPIQSAKPRSRPTPARLLWLLNRQAMLTPTTPAHGPPRSLPPKSNATRSLPGKISGMTQWMLPCPAPLK